MNDQNQKNQKNEESPKIGLGEPVVQASSWKRLLSRKWVYPAAYMATAAIILTLVWVYQDASRPKPQVKETAGMTTTVDNTPLVDSSKTEEGASVSTAATPEDFVWPVANAAEVTVVKPFYDKDGTAEDHVAAMVKYNDTFFPNTGIDLARGDNKTFEVKAALSGKVTRVEQTPLTGYVVEITNANNLKTVYESLTDVKVKKDAEVKQGDTLASAGSSELEKDLGNHVHFAVYEDGAPVNPATLLPQK
ncbi:M23 family metallopeptidase [Paenibacillus sp. YPG26]|uniref:M23 family metallopeptidase n=1 Tax=Paenibacillus sp. YPG26 TaxID=2878915 RepID=UPI00203FA8DC|nr:M23 family metallopeptidase [Paenibacillus sp. YPG26]USB32875.1 M23 family metallopeptidase [Paenibacillus sp. YPG26]